MFCKSFRRLTIPSASSRIEPYVKQSMLFQPSLCHHQPVMLIIPLSEARHTGSLRCKFDRMSPVDLRVNLFLRKHSDWCILLISLSLRSSSNSTHQVPIVSAFRICPSVNAQTFGTRTACFLVVVWIDSLTSCMFGFEIDASRKGV